MAKLQDMFSQPHRVQGAGGMGFLGKNKSTFKPRSTAIVIEFPSVVTGNAEAVLKAGADGLLFDWNGGSGTTLEDIQKEIELAKAANENVVSGLRITDGLDTLNRDRLAQIKDAGIQYIIVPLSVPAQVLALETKGLEKVVTVPMRSGEMYPIFIRTLSSLDGIAAVLLDFQLPVAIDSLSIEDILPYQAVREAVRFPAFLTVQGDLSATEVNTLKVLGPQALILTTTSKEQAVQQVTSLRETLETVYQEEKDSSTPSQR